MSTTSVGPDGIVRCAWAHGAPEFPAYHDTEWGFPVVDDQRLFEKICLEGFQSGLSWRTILVKRPAFRSAFAGFSIEAVAAFDGADVERLLGDAGIVRHRGKIEATVNNAGRALEMISSEGSLAAWAWGWEPAPEALAVPQTVSTSTVSDAMSKDLRKRGWKFVGPTTVYSFLQAMGLINDHVIGCVTRDEVAAARAAFTPPT